MRRVEGDDARSAILLAVGGLVHREIAIDALLDRVVRLICEELGADRGTIYLVDRARGEVVSRAAPGLELEEIRLRLGQGVAGHVAATAEVVNVPAAASEARFFDGVDARTGYATRSLLAAPMLDEEGAVIGVVQLLNKRSGVFSADDESTLSRLSADAAVAVRATTLFAELDRPRDDAAEPIPVVEAFNRIIGSSAALGEACRVTRKAARTEATVLIGGESGTGKELFARALHVNSPRRDGPFVKVDCAALPETLIENELFGHEAGAYTGAERASRGLVDHAAGGTLFLDEIGELPLGVQAKLLRLLQDRTYRRVGGAMVVAADVRVVAATHRDLAAAVAEGRFRADLYYRVKVVELTLPPLRERGAEDIHRLARHFAREAARRHGLGGVELSPDALAALAAHLWPGNVRELEHCVESAAVLHEGERIEAGDLPLPERARALPETQGGLRPLAQVERAHVLRVLDAVAGNQTEAARILGIGRNTLARKLARYGPGSGSPSA